MKKRLCLLAKSLSLHSPHHTHKLGAVIAKKGRPLSVGFNSCQTHPKSIHPFQTLHAEISALIGMSFDKSKGCDAYVYREIKNGSPGLAKPCGACHQALKLAGIKRMYYTTPSGWREEKL